jgi:hypothetical protein
MTKISELKKEIERMEKGCSHFITETKYYILKAKLCQLNLMKINSWQSKPIKIYK